MIGQTLRHCRRKDATAFPETGTRTVTGILTETRFFRLRKAIRVSEARESGVWVHESTTLGTHSYGETREGSWKAFIEIFESDWESIAQEKDSKLAKGAQQLKRKYLDLVEHVEPVL